MKAVQVPGLWITYVMMGVWMAFGISIILASIALWRIATLLRRIAFRMEHPTPVPSVLRNIVTPIEASLQE